MIDIPLNKALVALETEKDNCNGCFFYRYATNNCFTHIACESQTREDGKSVIFKLVDWPEERQ